jgi:hypothetical protein
MCVMSWGAGLFAQRFGAAIVLGPSLSQVQGEGNAGYDKLGFSGGLQGIVFLSDRFDMYVDLLYSQRGSRSSLIDRSFIDRNGFDLDYIDIPVSFVIKDWIQEAEDGMKYGKLGLYGGASYGRLVRSRAIGFDQEAADQVSSNDLSLLAGLRFQWNRNWALNVRYTRSIQAVAPAYAPDELNPLFPYSINLRLEYIL